MTARQAVGAGGSLTPSATGDEPVAAAVPAVAAEADRRSELKRRRRLHLPHLGLRARITLAFTVSAALLSTLLAGTTWALTRESVLRQREAAATHQAYINAQFMKGQLSGGVDEPDQLLAQLSSLDTGQGSRSLLQVQGRQPVNEVASFGIDALPPSFRERVKDNQPSRMRIEVDGEPQLVVGIPLPSVNSAYYEFVSLDETQSTLESLSVSLFGAALVTTLAGAALGLWASRRTLRPLADVGVAAEAIAGGRLDTRLQQVDDPDLHVLVDSFNHMASHLEERIDRDGRFASDVSHELRSPLMTISASIEVLASRRDDMPDASARSAVDLLVADIGRFKQLVEDLLEISRFDAGAARLELSEVRLDELVTQAVGWSSERDVPVDLDPALSGVVVRADKRRLVRVIANLIDNAQKYGGGATGVELRKVQDGVRIAVEDQGPGVPATERDLIFDRFARGVGAHRRSGTEGVGLGLSLVAEHVSLHKGRVWVEDRPDGAEGARFVVELPVAWS